MVTRIGCASRGKESTAHSKQRLIIAQGGMAPEFSLVTKGVVQGWSQTGDLRLENNGLPMSVESLARSLTDFLTGARDAVAIEGGQVLFDFATAKYAVKAENGRCVLHLWSDEHNA